MKTEELRLKIKNNLLRFIEKTFSRHDQEEWLTKNLDNELFYKGVKRIE